MQHSSTRISVSAIMIAAICCSLTANSSLRADTIYSVQFENNQGILSPAVNFSGVEPDAAAHDTNFSQSNVWNHFGAEFSQVESFFASLVDSTGPSVGAQLSISNINGAANAGSTLPDTYFYSSTSSIFSISGLAANSAFTLFLYPFDNGLREEVFTVGNSTFDSAPTGLPGAVTGVTSATGTIAGTWNFGSHYIDLQIDWAGFQLDVASPAASVPEPATLARFGVGVLVLAGGAWRRLLA